MLVLNKMSHNFGYYSAKTNRYEGMEVDLAKKIADELKVK